jgi:hypothetical protein
MTSYTVTNTVEVEGQGGAQGICSLSDGTNSVSIVPTTVGGSTYTMILPDVAGTADQVLSMVTPTDLGWKTIGRRYWFIQHTMPSGSMAGGLPLGWMERLLNSIDPSPTAGTFVQLAVAPASTNQLLIEPGDYFIFAKVTTGSRAPTTSALWNLTTASIEIEGTSCSTSSNAPPGGGTNVNSMIIGTFNVAITSVYNIQTYMGNSSAFADSQGSATGVPGVDELYIIVYIERL